MCGAYVHVCAQLSMCSKGERKTLGILLYHSLPYSLATGSLTKPEGTLVASKPQRSSCLHLS